MKQWNAIYRASQVIAVMISFALSLLAIFVSQAASPDYKMVFWMVLKLLVIDMALVAFIWTFRDRQGRWLAGIPAAFAFLFLLELGCRVWLGFQLL